MRLERKQKGFGLVAATFLIIVIAGIIAAMTRLAVTQSASVGLAMQQARAYQAARAGLEWGISRFLSDQTCTELLFNVPGLDGFMVTVECPVGERVERNDLHEEDLQGIVIQRIVATAEYSNVGSPDYAYRKLSTVVELGREIP